MTVEQYNQIKKDVDNFIRNISNGNSTMIEEVKSLIKAEYADDDDFVIICWPEIQALMIHEGFDTNACLANDEWTLDKYGSSAYFVNRKWLTKTLLSYVEQKD
jgi:hypothetical protein